MSIEVTVAIDPAVIEEGQTTTVVAIHLIDLGGGQLFSWTPELGGEPAKATFRFESEACRKQFVATVLEIQGVSLSARR